MASLRRAYRVVAAWRLALPLVVVALIVAARFTIWRTPVAPTDAAHLLAEGQYTVARAVDGDTLELATGERIRLFGVDTPETVEPNKPVEPWGPEAAAFTRSFIEQGPVRLTFDRERQDKYGRYLAYVWRGDVLLNEQLILAGLSPAVTYFPFSVAMKDRFRDAQRAAKKAKRGLWQDSRPEGRDSDRPTQRISP